MTAGNPDNSRNVIKYTGQNYTFTPAYMRSRDPTTNDIRDPKNQGYYPFTALWINKTNQNLWSLVKIANNLATWILLSGGGSGPLLKINVPAGTATTVNPDAGGNITFTSSGGTIAITGSTALNPNFINFDLAGGGVAVDQIGVDAAAAPGTNPVIPVPATGQIDIRGGATFITGTLATPIRTNSLAANRLDIQSQLSGSNAGASTANNFGVSQADSNQFDVTGGFWQLKGGGVTPAVTKFNVDADNAPGTDPVVADATGQITVTGAQVAAGVVGTNVIRTDSLAANTWTTEIQRSTAVAASAVANNGVSHFDSAYFTVDASGFVQSKSGLTPGVSNLGITYVVGTGVFSVTAANGTALSAANPAYVTIPSKTAGIMVRIPVTANQSFIDDNGASEIIGNLFGWTTGVAITVDVPFFIYAVLNDAETAIQFMLCRYPHLKTSTTAANIGMPSTPAADAESAFFSFDNITAADWESNPALVVGSMRMRMSASDDWTVQTLAITDGIGLFQEQTFFSTPLGQLGAVAGQWVKNNGGTAAIFSDLNKWWYKLSRDGMFNGQCDMSGDGGTDGAGAVAAQVICPIKSTDSVRGGGFGIVTNTTVVPGFVAEFVPLTSNVFIMNYATDVVTAVTWAAFGNGNRGIRVNFNYMIATS